MSHARYSSVVLICLGLGVFSGCRSSSNTNNDGGNSGADAAGGEHTIYDVQDDSMPVGTTVTLRGVVVVAIDTYGGRTGGVYVQEPAGGPYSGVFVFLNDTSAAGLSVGDLVDVVGGVKDEFALSDDTTGRTLTEVSPPQGGSITITKVGDGTVPTPPVVVPWELAADDAEAEKWEGVLITFENVAVTSAPRNVSMSDPLLKEMTVTGPFAVSSSLTELADTIARDDCYSSITGIGDYFFSYKILPRSAADFGAPGTSCLPQEEGDTACGDGEDNDHDGFSDCDDFSCVDTVAACTTETTCVDVQNGTVATNTPVVLNNVVVTAIAFNQKNFWVQDQAAAGPYNGVYVFRGSGAPVLPGTVQIGSIVNVTGTTAEFASGGGGGGETITEVAGNVTVTEAGGTAKPVIVTGQGIAALKGEEYEGVLVTLEAVPVLDADLGNFMWSVGTAGNDLVIDDDIYREMNVPTAGMCVTITGVMHWNPFDHQRVLLPRDGEVVTVTCP